MTEIRPDLRALIVRARKDPARWGGRHGLSQAQLAEKAGTSQVWLRQIETGYTESAKADTLGNICFVLSIEPALLRHLGYEDVAEAVEAAVLLQRGDGEADAVRHLRETPGLTAGEREQLVQALKGIHREEPYGQELWRRKKR